YFFFQAEDGIRDFHVTGVQTCALPISDSGQTSANSTDYALGLDEILANDTFMADPSPYNGSSIAFILEADDKTMLYLGDSHDEIDRKSVVEGKMWCSW